MKTVALCTSICVGAESTKKGRDTDGKQHHAMYRTESMGMSIAMRYQAIDMRTPMLKARTGAPADYTEVTDNGLSIKLQQILLNSLQYRTVSGYVGSVLVIHGKDSDMVLLVVPFSKHTIYPVEDILGVDRVTSD